MITIENLTKFYGKNKAVNNISFNINDNEILGFLGPNGAGKSTTMNMIAGYLPMSDGTVKINGIDVSKEPDKAKRDLGYLPEIPPVYPDMKVKEYISFCAGLKKIPLSKKKSEIDRVLNLLKITDVKDKLIKNLSKGYKQRVAFAQALLGNPKFLILDEPTVGLDPNQVIEVRKIISDLRKEHSVIFSSHILSEISAVCDRVVIISKGDIKAIDTIENLENSFQNRLILNVKIAGRQEYISATIRTVNGIEKILEVKPEDNNVFNYRIQLNGNADEIRNNVMTVLIENKLQIIEIYTEKPNLEDVFIKLVNQPTKQSSLLDLVSEIAPEEESDSNAQINEKEEI